MILLAVLYLVVSVYLLRRLDRRMLASQRRREAAFLRDGGFGTGVLVRQFQRDCEREGFFP